MTDIAKFADLGPPRARSDPAAEPLFPLEGAGCGPCRWRAICASQTGRHACLEWPVDAASVPFHPLFGYGANELARVGGPELDDIVAQPVVVPSLGLYIPQLRYRTIPDGQLPPRVAYGIRLDQVLRRKVWTAQDVRVACGIPPGGALVLFCFADDDVLEQLWDDDVRVRAIAEGGWDMITAPSYSLWFRRPRPQHFHAIRRSFDMYAALQDAGGRAIPRVAFLDRRDVERQADWCNANDCVGMVSLDLMTCRRDTDWLDNADLTDLFDELTGRRLSYLVNGTRVFPRIRYLFELLGSKRVVVSDATAAAPPPDLTDDFEEVASELLLESNSEWRRRISSQQKIVDAAQKAALARTPDRVPGLRAPDPSNIDLSLGRIRVDS